MSNTMQLKAHMNHIEYLISRPVSCLEFLLRLANEQDIEGEKPSESKVVDHCKLKSIILLSLHPGSIPGSVVFLRNDYKPYTNSNESMLIEGRLSLPSTVSQFSSQMAASLAGELFDKWDLTFPEKATKKEGTSVSGILSSLTVSRQLSPTLPGSIGKCSNQERQRGNRPSKSLPNKKLSWRNVVTLMRLGSYNR